MGTQNSLDNAHGFTFIELMVVLMVLAIFAKVALPSFYDLLQGNRVQATQAEFQNALALARFEAIKRGANSRVTVVANALTGTSANWASGVSVFFDTTDNGNGNVPPADPSLLVLKTNAVDSQVQVVTSNNANRIIFQGSGQIYSGYSTFAFGPYNATWRCTVIAKSGRVRSATVASAACSNASCCA